MRKLIDLGDANGVALAAIQALHRDVATLRADNARLEEEVRHLREQLRGLLR